MVRCKMKCTLKEANDGGFNLRFQAVVAGSAENESFFKYTPGGELNFYTVNAIAAVQIKEGKEYYIDITPSDGSASI